MKNEDTKLSLCGRLMQKVFFPQSNMGFRAERTLSIAMFIVSILWLYSATHSSEEMKFIYSAAFGLFSIIWFVKSGCSELREKKYINQNSNQGMDFTGETPVD